MTDDSEIYWVRGEPPHKNEVEVLGWWEKSECYGVIFWSDSENAFLDAEDRCHISAPTHHVPLSPPIG